MPGTKVFRIDGDDETSNLNNFVRKVKVAPFFLLFFPILFIIFALTLLLPP